ncbi:UDP-N-acetyl-D-mannosamine dehydrogenase [Cellulomonas sp. HZM]|uniref:UDP-N-acetyl-D-mannosamine dehydrogenase n=1 Tax=Cellulomonas sp. HZM TaxID=1454010 RepID=UPI00055487E0|nr:UDP-N-acetyl-D-mannosamine dehydrogenase [Cellulomonas sp. HZM]
MGTNLTAVVVGLGYIGLPTAAILAANGVTVHGVDVSQRTVDAVNAGTVPFVEPDLAGYVAKAVADGLLGASTEVKAADVYIVAVPTPFLDDRSPDLSYIRAAAGSIAPHLASGALVILESTSPPGATRQLYDWLIEARPDLRDTSGEATFLIAHCPERVLPGRVMVELVTNDRIVGGLTPAAAERAKEVYEVFCQGQILLTDAVTAEMAKLVENSFRDVNIAFANELSLIADRLGIDVWELIDLANHHPRVNILQPGPGVGGHCIAVDPWFIVAADPQDARLIRTAREVNDAKPRWVVEQVVEAVATIANPVIATLGLAFKADIDDMRESPARQIVGLVADAVPSGRVLAVEPHVDALPIELGNRRNVELTDYDAAMEQADVVVLLVDHVVFRSAPLLDPGVVVIDTKGAWR